MSKYSILGVIAKKILRVIFKEQNLWVMFIKEVQFFESHSEKGSNLWVILEKKSSILLCHIQKCSILWAINQTKVQFFWVVNQKKSSILLGRKSEKKVQLFDIFKKKSLSQTFLKNENILWVTRKKGFNFFESYFSKIVQFCELCFQKVLNSLNHIFKAFNSLSHIFKKIFNSVSYVFKKYWIHWVIFSKRSILWVIFSKSIQFFESYFAKRSILWVIFSKSIQFFESYFAKKNVQFFESYFQKKRSILRVILKTVSRVICQRFNSWS